MLGFVPGKGTTDTMVCYGSFSRAHCVPPGRVYLQHKACKDGIDSKWPCVNLMKTKLLVSGIGFDVLRTQVPLYWLPQWGWQQPSRVLAVHVVSPKLCSGGIGTGGWPRLHLPQVSPWSSVIDSRHMIQLDIDNTILDVEAIFCYMGNSAIATKFCMALGKRRKFLPIHSISQEICTRFLLCCALLWLYIDWFSHIHQAYFTGIVAI